MIGLLLAVIWLGFFAAIAFRWEKGEGTGPVVKKGPGGKLEMELHSPIKAHVRSWLLLALGVGLTPFWFVFGNNCFLTIPPAHVSAVYDPMRGGIQKDVLPEGFHVVMPWWQTQQFLQQTQEYTMSGSGVSGNERGSAVGDSSIRCQTNEGMNVEIDCTVLFHVDPSAANNVWQKLGDDVVKLIVRPYTHNVMRMVVARYSVVDVYANRRKQVETEITDMMKPLFAEKGVVLEQLLIRNIVFGNPAFADAINAKQVAEQQVQTEYQKLNRAKIEKQTVIAEAQGEATAISRRGATLRQNPEVVQYEFVQKVAPRMRTMYLPASELPSLRGGK